MTQIEGPESVDSLLYTPTLAMFHIIPMFLDLLSDDVLRKYFVVRRFLTLSNRKVFNEKVLSLLEIFVTTKTLNRFKCYQYTRSHLALTFCRLVNTDQNSESAQCTLMSGSIPFLRVPAPPNCYSLVSSVNSLYLKRHVPSPPHLITFHDLGRVRTGGLVLVVSFIFVGKFIFIVMGPFLTYRNVNVLLILANFHFPLHLPCLHCVNWPYHIFAWISCTMLLHPIIV